MSKQIQAIRGMNDILPEDSIIWEHVEALIQQTFERYAYREIRFPILEKTELFKRSVGEVTDIVEKEMYTFEDRNGDSLSLRPEGTAGCVRAGIENGLLYNQIQRLWYMGPFYRHERPQKGRYRQFHQCGAEAFGIATPDIDAEMILLTRSLLKSLGLLSHVTLQINTLGSLASRASHREALLAYLNEHLDQLDEDSQRRLHTNPLRILDSKNPAMQALIANAPKLIDYLDEESKQHFGGLCAHLNALNIAYEINPHLVRGLDYYCHTVFEWVTHSLGAQGTVCAGGRYDGLVEQLGGKATPAIGFAMGIERVVLLLKELGFTADLSISPDVFMIALTSEAQSASLQLAEDLRDEHPSLICQTHCGGGSLKNQLKKADKSDASIAIILGDDEVKQKTVIIKYLREDKPQETLSWDELLAFFY